MYIWQAIYNTKAYVAYLPILLHHFQLIFRHFIHGNLDMTCQHRVKGV